MIDLEDANDIINSRVNSKTLQTPHILRQNPPKVVTIETPGEGKKDDERFDNLLPESDAILKNKDS